MFNKRRKKFNKKQFSLRQKREIFNIWWVLNAPIARVDLVYWNYRNNGYFHRPKYAIPNVKLFMSMCETRLRKEMPLWFLIDEELNS